MSPPKREIFSLEAANALIPRIRGICEEQFERRASIERALRTLGDKAGEVSETLTVTAADKREVRETKQRILALIDKYRAGWREIEDLGVVVKDPRIGLVDFFGAVDGRTVFFCWRYGEESITHYHGIDEGFAGRKPIQSADKQRMLN
jgi:hypothetical protein